MSQQAELSPLGHLVLARLLVAPEKGVKEDSVRKDLDPFLQHRWTAAEIAEQLDRTLEALATSGLIDRYRKGKSRLSMLTADGRHRILDDLGLEALPPKTTWAKLKKNALPALAIGLPSPTGDEARRFGLETGFKAALLKAHFDLPLRDVPALPEAVEALTCQLAGLDPTRKFSADALAWKLLGIDSNQKFTARAVQAALINRALGDDGRETDPKKGAAKLLARKVGARRADANELRQVTIRHWVGGPSTTSEPARPIVSLKPAPAPTVAVSELDPDRFARRVREAARSSTTGRFGDNKVFIAHVWQALQHDPAFANMSSEDFKRRLVEANTDRRLDLGRADLVEAMDPEDVRRSEVRHLGASFHFVRIPREGD